MMGNPHQHTTLNQWQCWESNIIVLCFPHVQFTSGIKKKLMKKEISLLGVRKQKEDVGQYELKKGDL